MLMVLDHARDFFNASTLDPSATLDPFLFFTRWITHFCAPVFMLLTGIAAYLYGTKGKSTQQVSRFLLTRGLWLIFAELVIVRFGWMFTFDLDYFLVQVIFAIGGAMIALAGLVFLPRWLIATISLVLIFGHNAFDHIRPESFGHYSVLWHFLHQPALLRFGEAIEVFVLYPLVPWIGVVSLGYVLGSLYQQPPNNRIRSMVLLGFALTIGFFLLRFINIYGNPSLWEPKSSMTETLISFFNVEKYPPSLLFLMMTLGPALVFLALAEHARGRLVNFFVVFGRVPFFFYVTHLYLVHFLAVLYAHYSGVGMDWLFGHITAEKPANYGVGILPLYAIWPLVIVILYPLCRWFSELKQRRKDWWLSYL